MLILKNYNENKTDDREFERIQDDYLLTLGYEIIHNEMGN